MQMGQGNAGAIPIGRCCREFPPRSRSEDAKKALGAVRQFECGERPFLMIDKGTERPQGQSYFQGLGARPFRWSRRQRSGPMFDTDERKPDLARCHEPRTSNSHLSQLSRPCPFGHSYRQRRRESLVRQPRVVPVPCRPIPSAMHRSVSRTPRLVLPWPPCPNRSDMRWPTERST